MIKLLKSHPFFSDKTIDSCTLLEHQGYCNENYLVAAEGKKYIARKLLQTDIDRKFEYEVQKLAFEKDITAEPLVFYEENGFMVSQFLEGVHKEVETSVPQKVKVQSSGGTAPKGIHYNQVFTSKDDLKLLAKTLRKLHSISIDAKPIELHIENKTDEVLKAFETIDNYPKENVLCHNDLSPQNIFFTDKVKLIDWEYTGVNDRYFDLACVCVEFKLDNEDEVFFLESYFLKKDVINYEKHKAYKVIYKTLCKQWFAENS